MVSKVVNGSPQGKKHRSNLMAETATIKLIEEKIKLVEAQGFGEVIIKIKNGAVWRVLDTVDTILPLGKGKALDKG